jgi:hypothetical protein
MRWDGLKAGLAGGRKSEFSSSFLVISIMDCVISNAGRYRSCCRGATVLRLVKPVEHLQSAVNTANAPVYVPFLPSNLLHQTTHLTFISFSSYFQSFLHESQSIQGLDPTRSAPSGLGPSDQATVLCRILGNGYDRLAPKRQVPKVGCRVSPPIPFCLYQKFQVKGS